MRNGSRHHIVVLLVTLTLSVITTGVLAGSPDLTLSGALCPTAGSLGHRSDIGYGGAICFELQPDPTNSPELEIGLRGSWNSFPVDEGDDYKVKSVQLNIKLNYALFREPNLFVVGGGGVAQVESGVKETSPVASIGIGIEHGALLVEARVTQVFGNHYKETTFFPITIGVTF